MKANWSQRLFAKLSLIFIACLLLGAITGFYAWSFVIGLTLIVAWQFRQLLRLLSWLAQEQHSEPPNSYGLWGAAFDSIYHLQQKNQQTQAELKSIITRVQSSTSALKDGVITLEANGTLNWWNPAATRMLRLKHPQDSQQAIYNLIRHPHFKEFYLGNTEDEFILESPYNDQLILQFHRTRFGAGEQMLLVRDVSRVHHLEQMRKDFVANVSHELRTPLTVIRGYLETLLDNAGERLNPRWSRALQQMQQQSERMQLLVNDLLLLARLETTEHATHYMEVDLTSLLQNIVNDAQSLSAEKHSISLEVQSAAHIFASASELHSAFANIIFNAVKYSPEGGDIKVRLWEDDDSIHVSVQDHGLGIESKHLPRLTERFYRVDSSRNSQSGGTGLGLAIVKHVLLRHQGSLEINSVLGQGSLFICHFTKNNYEQIT